MNARRQSSNRKDLALLMVRLVTGVIFIAHGWQKLFLLGPAGVAQAFGGMGVPFPGVVGPAIGVIEILGGTAIIFGLLTRLASLGLAGDALGALILVHAKNGFFVPGGIEFVMLLAANALALAVAGAGQYSIDAMRAGRRSDAALQPTWRPSR